MASTITFRAAAFLAVAVIATWAAGKTSATTYVVGGSSGWSIPSGGAATYAAFAAQNTFQVGDHLVFNFPNGAHNMALVSKQDYDGCSSSSPIQLVTTSPATVNLTSIGEAYFICTFSGHCSLGQKLAVNVSAATSPAPASPPPTPAPKPSPTTAPAPSMTAPVPAPSTGMSPPAPAPAPGPGGAAPVPSPAMAPGSALAPGAGSPGSSPSPGSALAPGAGSPGGPPGDVPPSAAPAPPAATAGLMLIAAIAITNFF